MINLKVNFIKKYKRDFLNYQVRIKKYLIVNSNLDINKNESLIIQKIEKLI